MNQALEYSQNHGDEVREFLPATQKTVRLPIWTTVLDRVKLLTLANYAKKYGAISTLPNLTLLAPSFLDGGKLLQATVGNQFITLRQDGKLVSRLRAGKYSVIVTDTSTAQGFRLVGPGVSKVTSVKGTGKTTWTLDLRKGVYTYSSPAGKGKKAFRVS